MSDNLETRQQTQAAAPVAVPAGADHSACLRTFERFAYRSMSTEEQKAALLELVDETSEAIRAVRADERWHFAERCHRIGCLLIQARLNLECVWSRGYRGTALLEQISSRSAICTRTLEYYMKLAAHIDPAQVARLAQACLPWLETREILNMAGHGDDIAARVAEALQRLPTSGDREARRPFSAWLKEKHIERQKVKGVPPAGLDQPSASDHPPLAS